MKADHSRTPGGAPEGTYDETSVRLDALVTDVIRADDAGEAVDREAVLQEHPEIDDW